MNSQKLFIKVGKIQFSVLYLILLGFTVFGKRFVSIWAGEKYGNSFYVALILIWPNTINLIQNVGIEIQRAKGFQKYRSIMYLLIAIMNIIISCVFITWWDEVGAALGTAVAWIIGSGIIMNLFYSKRVGLDIKRFWIEILNMSKCGFPLLIIGLLADKYINSMPIILYFCNVFLFGVAYILLLYFGGLNREERNQIKNMILMKMN